MAQGKPRIFAILGLKDAQFNRGIRRAERRMRSFSASASRVGRTMTTGVTMPMGLAAVAAAKFAADFEKSMVKIQTLVGIPKEFTEEWGQAILAMSSGVARGPNELAKALFVVTSAGIRSAEALKIVERSAQASVVGLGDTATIARTVTAAMQAWSKEGLTAAEAVDTLTATVRFGNVESEELAGSMGRVMGIAAQMGVSFQEVGAFIATYTRVGVDANIATTALRATLSTMLGTGDQANQVLKDMGMSADDLRKALDEEGLAKTLVSITEKFGNNTSALKELTPNIRALAGVLAVAASQSEEYLKIEQEMMSGTVKTADEFKIASQTLSAQFDQLKADGEKLAIMFGNKMKPTIISLIAFVKTLTVELSKMSDEQIKNTLLWTAIAAAAGPVIIAIGLISASLLALAKGAILAYQGIVKLLPVLATVFGTFVGIASVITAVAASALFASAFDPQTLRDFLKPLGIVGKGIDYLIQRVRLFRTGSVLLGRVLENTFIKAVRVAFEAVGKLVEFIPGMWGDAEKAALKSLKSQEAASAATVEKLKKDFRELDKGFGDFWDKALSDAEGDGGGGGTFDVLKNLQKQIEETRKTILEGVNILGEGNPLTGTVRQQARAMVDFFRDIKREREDALASSPEDRFNLKTGRGIEALKEIYDDLALQDTSGAQLQKIADSLGIQGEVTFKKFAEAYRGVEQDIFDANERIKINLGEMIAQPMSQVFTGILRGTRDAKDILGAFTDMSIGMFGQMFEEMIKQKLNFDMFFEKNFLEELPNILRKGVDSMGKILGDFFSWAVQALRLLAQSMGLIAGPAGVAGSVDQSGAYAQTAAPFTVDLGAATPRANYVAMATGGITTGKRLAMVGDNPSGREAIIPLERWQEVMGSAGGGAPTIEIHSPSPLESQSTGTGKEGQALVQLVFQGAKQAVASDIMDGGIVSRSIQAAFSTNRKGGR